MYALLKTEDSFALRHFLRTFPDDRIFPLAPSSLDALIGDTMATERRVVQDFLVYIRDMNVLRYLDGHAGLVGIGRITDLMPNVCNIVCTRHYKGQLDNSERHLAEIERYMLERGHINNSIYTTNDYISITALTKPEVVLQLNDALSSTRDVRRVSIFNGLDLKLASTGTPYFILFTDPRRGNASIPLFVPKNSPSLKVAYINSDTRPLFPWLGIAGSSADLVLVTSFDINLLVNFMEETYGLHTIVRSGTVPADSGYAICKLQYDVKFLAHNPSMFSTGKTYDLVLSKQSLKLTVKKLTLPSGVVEGFVESCDPISGADFTKQIGMVIDIRNSTQTQYFA